MHADADADANADAGGIAIALLHWSAGALKMRSLQALRGSKVNFSSYFGRILDISHKASKLRILTLSFVYQSESRYCVYLSQGWQEKGNLKNWRPRLLLNVTYKVLSSCIANILNKKERYIKFSLKLRICHLNIVKEYIVICNHQCFMVDMSCRGDR